MQADSSLPGSQIPQLVFCDESGMTGNDLLDQSQAFFTYAGVAVSTRRAEEIIRAVRPKSAQGAELKGRNLLGTAHGRLAITELISQVRDDAHLVAHHKKYALACKFFEYIFEPVLAAQSSLFYRVGFHRFVANLIYVWSLTRQESAEQLLAAFAAYMRSLDPRLLPNLFSGGPLVLAPSPDDPLSAIGTFCAIHRQSISQEVEDLHDTHTGKWVLDLTSTSLFSVLSHWGERYEQLDVLCDDSKPLKGSDLFDCMVNRVDRKYETVKGRRRLLTFNLARSPQLVRSKDHLGVQIADILASALRFALENPKDDEAQGWLQALEPSISADSVVPDPQVLNLEKPEALVNAMLLYELVERSVRGKDLFADLPELIRAALLHAPEYQRLNKP